MTFEIGFGADTRQEKNHNIIGFEPRILKIWSVTNMCDQLQPYHNKWSNFLVDVAHKRNSFHNGILASTRKVISFENHYTKISHTAIPNNRINDGRTKCQTLTNTHTTICNAFSHMCRSWIQRILYSIWAFVSVCVWVFWVCRRRFRRRCRCSNNSIRTHTSACMLLAEENVMRYERIYSKLHGKERNECLNAKCRQIVSTGKRQTKIYSHGGHFHLK